MYVCEMGGKFSSNIRLTSDPKVKLSSSHLILLLAFLLIQHIASYSRRDITFAQSVFIFALGIPVIIVPWIEKKSKNIIFKVCSSFVAISFSVAAALTTVRSSIIAKMLLSAVFIVVYVIAKNTLKEEIFAEEPAYESFGFQMMFTLGGLAINAFNFMFIETTVPFLWYAVAFGVIFGVGMFMPIWRKKDNTQPLGTKVGVFLVCCAMFAVLSWGIIANLNYVLDNSKPKEYHAEIRDKRIIDRYRGGDDYEFTVVIDGKMFKREVTSSEYNSYEIGDTYTVNRYNGAFGEPFFMAD